MGKKIRLILLLGIVFVVGAVAGIDWLFSSVASICFSTIDQ